MAGTVADPSHAHDPTDSARPAKPYGPTGDPSRHLPRDVLDRGLLGLPPRPRDVGRVALLVARLADGTRATPERVTLTPAAGMPDDAWARRQDPKPEAQLTVMDAQVAALLANGQALSVSGDNLIVDLDLSAANLPVGTRLQLGEALVEVTPKPHNGCKKFAARFGEAARDLVQDEATRHLNLRGVYFRVVEAGDVAVGAPVAVVLRGDR